MRGRVLFAALALAAVVQAQTHQNPLPPSDPQKKQEFELVHADEATFDGDDVRATGNIHARFKGYDIYAERLVGNKRTQIFRLEGKARLVGKGSEVLGGLIVVDFKSDTYSFEDGKATLSPETLQGQAQKPVFVDSASGSGTANSFTIKKGQLTTCDLEHPHSKFVVGSSHIRPGRYVELRNVRLEVLGNTILGLPYLVIPLIENGTKYLPDVGQSPDEGQYVKTRISTPLPGESYFDTRVDYMTRLGPALGVDYFYEAGGLDGVLKAYSVLGPEKSSTISANHKQKVGSGNLLFDANYQQRNYLTAPQTTSVNTRMQYVLPTGLGTTRFSWFRVGNDRPGFSSLTQTLSMSDARPWSKWLTTQFDANLARSETNSTSSATSSDRLDIRFTGRTDLRSFTADLLYMRSIPIGDTENFFSSTDRTPMLVLKTDARRLLDARVARLWPFTTEMSVGELADPASGGSISRFDFNFGMARTDTKGRSALRWQGAFKQGIYSDDTAQYILDYNLGWIYNFDSKSRFELGYRNRRSFGFTPLSMDRTGRNDAFSMNLVYQLTKAFSMTARTGYDVLQADRGNVPWQQVWIQTAWNPSKALQVRTSSTYDTFNQVWNNLRMDASYVSGDTRFGIGTRFDGRRSVWASGSVFLEGLRIGKTTFGTALDYNGYSQRFEAQHYSVIYDLHEAELVLDFMDNNVGFRSGRQISLFLRLKAFPTRSPFGSGTRGQAIGGGTGMGF